MADRPVKGFSRDTTVRHLPRASAGAAQLAMGVEAGDLATGRGFRYEWEDVASDILNRVDALESGGGVAPTWSNSVFTALDATAQTVQAAPATFGGYELFNPNTNPVYVQVYDALMADVTVGTTPAAAVYGIPADSGANVEFSNGVEYSVGIAVAVTSTATGATGPVTPIVANILHR